MSESNQPTISPGERFEVDVYAERRRQVETKWYPQDIVDDADSREPWPSQVVRDWYMEGRLVEREQASMDASKEER